MQIATLILGFLGGSSVGAVVVACLNRVWTKKDRQASELANVVTAQKLIMLDRVRYLGKNHIKDGHISLEDKETLIEMHKAYKALGGNGHLDTVMDEVEHLPIK